jgi:hypothetical protein
MIFFSNNMKVIIFLFLLFSSNYVLAADRHVGSGQTYSTIQSAVTASSCGDTIYIHAGTYNESLDIQKSCSSSTPIIITPYSTDVVTINPASGGDVRVRSNYVYLQGKNQMTLNGPGTLREYGVVQFGSSTTGLQVKDLIIVSNSASRSGIHIWDTNNSLIQGVTIRGTYYRGIEGSQDPDSPTVGSYNLTIQNCTFVNPDYAGVEASATSYWLIQKNYFYTTSSGRQHHIVHRGGSNWLIRNNVFELRSGGGVNSIAVLRPDASYSGYNIVNEVYMNNTFATTGGTVNNSYGVIFFAWDDTGIDHTNVRFQNNLFIGNWGTSNGIFQWGSGSPTTSNCNINNNHKTASDSNSPWGNPTGYTLVNNTNGAISYNASGNKPSPFFDLTASLDGSASNSPPSDDYDGVTRSTPPEIGAFEFAGVVDPPPSPPTGFKIGTQ